MKKYTYRRVRWVGKKDGRNWKWKFWPFSKTPKEPQPDLNQPIPAEYEKELKEAGESIIGRLSPDWESMDSRLKPKYCQIYSESLRLKEQCKIENKESKIANQQYDEKAQKFYELQEPDLSKFWMIFWLVVFGVAEFPLNGLIFSIFGEQRIPTYIMAGVICIGIPLLAHWVGQTLRQENKSKMDWIIISAIPTFIVATFFSIGFLRAKYLSALLNKLPIGISISPAMAIFLFLILNIALFIVAGIISYAGSHPHHSLYITRQKRMEEALDVLNKEMGEARYLTEQLAQTQRELAGMRNYREKKWKWHYEKANEVKENAEFLIAAYRKANMEVRTVSTVPECFKKPPLELSIPDNLLNLDWNCSDTEAPKDMEKEAQ